MQLTWTNIKSALISALITAVLAIGVYILGVGDVFKIDAHALINVTTMSTITALVSLLKSMMTTAQGNFVGIVNIK